MFAFITIFCLIVLTFSSVSDIWVFRTLATIGLVASICITVGESADKYLPKSVKLQLIDQFNRNSPLESIRNTAFNINKIFSFYSEKNLVVRFITSSVLTIIFVFTWSTWFPILVGNYSSAQVVYFIFLQPHTYVNILVDFAVISIFVYLFGAISNLVVRINNILLIVSMFIFSTITFFVFSLYAGWSVSAIVAIGFTLFETGFSAETFSIIPSFFYKQVLAPDKFQLLSHLIFWTPLDENTKIVIGGSENINIVVHYFNMIRSYLFSTLFFPMILIVLIGTLALFPVIFRIHTKLFKIDNDVRADRMPFSALGIYMAVIGGTITALFSVLSLT